jgi:death-on-curing protein
MSIRYLDYETVVDINADHAGPGSGVRDEAGIRAALGRASATFMGVDLVPSLLAKAAVIMHGLSSTQYFHDGNKRTAWLASNLFLEMNDAPLKRVPVINAEAFVVSIATKGFETDEGGAQAAIDKATDWFTQNRHRMRDRLDYAILALDARIDAHNDTFSAENAQLASVGMSAFPHLFVMTAIVRINFTQEDAYREWSLRVSIDSPTGAARIVTPNAATVRYMNENDDLPAEFDLARDVVDFDESVALAFEDLTGQHETGVVPSLTVMNLPVLCNFPGRADFVFTVNSQFLVRRAFELRRMPDEQWEFSIVNLGAD